MAKFIVQIAEVRNYEIAVTAADHLEAEAKAMKIYRDAPELGSYEIPDTTVEVMAVTQQKRARRSS